MKNEANTSRKFETCWKTLNRYSKSYLMIDDHVWPVFFLNVLFIHVDWCRCKGSTPIVKPAPAVDASGYRYQGIVQDLLPSPIISQDLPGSPRISLVSLGHDPIWPRIGNVTAEGAAATLECHTVFFRHFLQIFICTLQLKHCMGNAAAFRDSFWGVLFRGKNNKSDMSDTCVHAEFVRKTVVLPWRNISLSFCHRDVVNACRWAPDPILPGIHTILELPDNVDPRACKAWAMGMDSCEDCKAC